MSILNWDEHELGKWNAKISGKDFPYVTIRKHIGNTDLKMIVVLGDGKNTDDCVCVSMNGATWMNHEEFKELFNAYLAARANLQERSLDEN